MVDADAAVSSQVNECQRHHHRQPERQRLAHQVAVPLQARGIGQDDDAVDLRASCLAAFKHRHRHLFIWAAGNEAVDARQVDQFDPSPREGEAAAFLLDGHTWIVAHPRRDAR